MSSPSLPLLHSSALPGVPLDTSDTSTEGAPDIRPVTEYLVSGRPPTFDYSVVRSLFVQSLPEYLIDQQEFNDNYFNKNFGLMLYNDNDEPDWQALVDKVTELNASAAPDETYKVLYLARHGQGPHNQAIEEFGHPEWNRKIALLTEFGGLKFGPDPDLTVKGKGEAADISKIWQIQITKYGLSRAGALPQKFYSSPFTRALRTLQVTWQDIVLNLPDAPRVTVCENLRETIGRHTCDIRGDMREVQKEFPFIQVEKGMSDEDKVWTEIREDERAGGPMDHRLRDVLDDIFLNDGETFISITGHSGCIRCILRVAGHRLFALETSRVIPIVVKAKLRPEFKDTKLPARVTGLPYTFVHPPAAN